MRVLFSRSVIVLVLSVLSFHINSKEPEFETFKTKGLEIRKLMGIIPTSDWKKYVSWVKGGEDTDINTYDPDTTVTRVLCMYPEGFRGKVILCFFSNLTGQFILTSRASIYSEAYQDKVLDHDQLYNNKLVPNHPDASKVIANSSRSLGHDVKGEKWAIVYENIKNFPMPEDERIRIFVDMERLFYDNIVKPEMDISSNSRANIKSPLYYNTTKPMTDDVIPNNEFVIITTKFSNREQQEDALQEFELIESTTSHERLHARYFLDKKYETTVDEYIDNKVSKDDMEFFLWSLEARGYVNIRYDDYLRRNEFMAYTLMYYNYDCGYRRIASDIMRNMVDYLQTKYKNDFIAYLKNNGVSPVE